jgi:hypothetical protein
MSSHNSILNQKDPTYDPEDPPQKSHTIDILESSTESEEYLQVNITLRVDEMHKQRLLFHLEGDYDGWLADTGAVIAKPKLWGAKYRGRDWKLIKCSGGDDIRVDGTITFYDMLRSQLAKRAACTFTFQKGDSEVYVELQASTAYQSRQTIILEGNYETWLTNTIFSVLASKSNTWNIMKYCDEECTTESNTELRIAQQERTGLQLRFLAAFYALR